MKEFRHSTGKNYFVMTKRCTDFHLEYDCIVQYENECKTFYGIRIDIAWRLYNVWCEKNNVVPAAIKYLFEPYNNDEPWKDLDRISIDDEEIVP